MPEVKKAAAASVKKATTPALEKPARTTAKTPRKSPAKKAATKNIAVNVVVEHHDRQISTQAVTEAAVKLWVLAGHDAAEIITVDLYVKQEDGAIYCVVNGEAVGRYDL